jgi:hypothetical protein
VNDEALPRRSLCAGVLVVGDGCGRTRPGVDGDDNVVVVVKRRWRGGDGGCGCRWWWW